MRTFFFGLLLLAPFVSPAQSIIGYRVSTLPGNQQLIFALYSDGSRQCVTSLPDNRPTDRVGGLVKLTYMPEPKRVLNVAQFGLDRYYSPNFKFSVDFRNMNESVDDRRRQGVNLFGNFTVSEAERGAMPFGQGLVLDTESGLHGPLEGAGFYENSLATLEQRYQDRVPGAEKGYWAANIESSSEWYPGNRGTVYPGFPRSGIYATTHFPEDWNTAKTKTITLETTGETNISLETLANRGYGAWELEKTTRRTNRAVLLLQIARQRSPFGGLCAFGSSMYQGQPDKGNAYQTSVFQEGYADVSHIGGNNGNITLNGRQYVIRGDVYSNETMHLDYYYQFKFRVSEADYNDIWINQNPARLNYESIWAAISTRHVVADQVGHWQANRYRMKNRAGQSVRPTMMMRELVYEADVAGSVDGRGDLIGRVPSGLDTGCIDFRDGGNPCDDLPKVWIPPYEMYTYYAVHRFLEGGVIGSGFHLFNAPGKFDFATRQGYNQPYHSVTALFQARADLQIYERFFDNSTMEEQPEIKPNQEGDWQRYDAIQAYNVDNGTPGPQRPVYLVRYAPVANGWRVVILGGHNLQHGQERTDLIRMPDGLLNGNQFRIKLRGPAAQVFEFIVSNQDNGQTYEATPTPQFGYERAGYAGRVGHD